MIVAVALLALSSCSVGYYFHAARGQLDVLSRRQPIEELIADEQVSEDLKARLKTVLAVRQFASDQLLLPDNDSYRSYADLERPYVVWNVFAAPEFSVEAKTWCFPIVGCVTYRGFFKEEKASAFGEGLRGEGYDVYIGGVPAYSTLGKFDDPVMNTMMHWQEQDLAAIIFHELAHQELYVKNDAPFSEAFAMVVEEEGLRRWFEAQGNEEALAAYRARRQRETILFTMIARTRARLDELYRSGLPDDEMRSAKAQELNRLREEYELVKASWSGYNRFDPWFNGALNNARIASLATYREFLPAFRALLARSGGDLRRFYQSAKDLAALDATEREEKMRGLMTISDGGVLR